MSAAPRPSDATPPSSYHEPVLLAPVRDFLLAAGPGVYVDATLGGAGHATALLEAAPDIVLIGIDRDPEARATAPRAPIVLASSLDRRAVPVKRSITTV